MHSPLTTCLFSLLIVGCASSEPKGIEREIRDREKETLRQQEEQAAAKTARMREQRQQGTKDNNKWVIRSKVNPVTQKNTCLVQPGPYLTKSYNGNKVELTIGFDETILRISTMVLLLGDSTGISVDGKPIHLFQRKTASGDLVNDKTQTGLLADLASGESAEVTFEIGGAAGLHKLQFELDGFGESYAKLNNC